MEPRLILVLVLSWLQLSCAGGCQEIPKEHQFNPIKPSYGLKGLQEPAAISISDLQVSSVAE